VPPDAFPSIHPPAKAHLGDPGSWEQALRRAVNFFYGAAAVESIEIKGRGRFFYEWVVHLFEANSPSWIAPHLPGLLVSIRSARSAGRFDGPSGLRVVGPGGVEAAHFLEHDAEGRNHFRGIPAGTECRLAIDGQKFVGVLRDGAIRIAGRNPYLSFSAASTDLAGRKGNARQDWEVRLPNTPEWVRADVFGDRLDKATDVTE